MHIGIALVWASLLAMTLAGCEQKTPPADGSGIEQRVANLEEGLAAVQDQNRSLKAKLRTVHAFGRSPLGDFFASPEFWECTYDSAWHDCSNRCASQTSAGYQACLTNHPEGPERVTCIENNSATGSACLEACPVQTSPTDPPLCR